jgi:hypothetical protein
MGRQVVSQQLEIIRIASLLQRCKYLFEFINCLLNGCFSNCIIFEVCGKCVFDVFQLY